MTELLPTISDALADTVSHAAPGVVRVEGRRRLPASGVVWSDDGVIVTAHHVVQRDDNLRVGLPNGRHVGISLVGRDPTTDLAVLRLEGEALDAPIWADTDGLRVGHMVLALGRPGKVAQATLGIVSALGGDWQTPAGGRLDRYLQTDVVMYPGFSGGPLVDTSGRVIGLNTSALVRGVSLTVPSATVARVVEVLLSHGRIRRGYLGVNVQPVRLPAAVAEQLDQRTGVLVVAVEPGSPAESGGLMLGDVIVTLDGRSVRELDDLLTLLTDDRIGSATQVRVLRGGAVHELQVAIGERTP